MALHTWEFDAPTGTYKSHTLSSKVRNAAIQTTKFMQFATPEPNFGKGKGETITITRFGVLAQPTSVVLTEGVKIPEDTLSITTTSFTVQEIGRAVPFTSLADDLSRFSLDTQVQKSLRDQLNIALDDLAATAMTSTDVKVTAIPTGASSLTFDTDGTPSTAATVNMGFYHVEQIRDYLFSTLRTPTYSNDEYVGIFTTKGLRGLKQDPAYEEWYKYTMADRKATGEVGKIENIRFVETNNTNVLSGSAGTGGVLGEGVIFGDDFLAMIEVETPELRAAIPADFGRQKAAAWYGVIKFGIPWNTATAGQAKGVRVTSS